MSDQQSLRLILAAAAFAADRHRTQLRKDVEKSPYINHPLELARILVEEGGVADPEVLAAALLHDTVEDTATSLAEIENRFGPRVAGMVAELTDDKALEKSERKRMQVVNAPGKTQGAKLVKLADKISNLRDILDKPPAHWPADRKRDYFLWAADVVAGLRGVSPALEASFDDVHARGLQAFAQAA
ncbi:HD domain-containing protein [Sphingomonas swuensis]|uniref:HD domain-containing protein n=1 Tax=Sphingomonas swuensis TaxID=977800 RepID=A0ABP7SSQ9_9SPHN